MSDGALPFGKAAKPELDEPGPRKPLTKFEFAEKFLEQGGRCYLCSAKLERGRVIDEHDPPRETLPGSICDDLRFRKLACRDCAKHKTVGDQAIIAKSRRLRGGRGSQYEKRKASGGSKIQGRKEIKSRGFDRTKSRGFDGRVRERT